MHSELKDNEAYSAVSPIVEHTETLDAYAVDNRAVKMNVSKPPPLFIGNQMPAQKMLEEEDQVLSCVIGQRKVSLEKQCLTTLPSRVKDDEEQAGVQQSSSLDNSYPFDLDKVVADYSLSQYENYRSVSDLNHSRSSRELSTSISSCQTSIFSYPSHVCEVSLPDQSNVPFVLATNLCTSINMRRRRCTSSSAVSCVSTSSRHLLGLRRTISLDNLRQNRLRVELIAASDTYNIDKLIMTTNECISQNYNCGKKYLFALSISDVSIIFNFISYNLMCAYPVALKLYIIIVVNVKDFHAYKHSVFIDTMFIGLYMFFI